RDDRAAPGAAARGVHGPKVAPLDVTGVGHNGLVEPAKMTNPLGAATRVGTAGWTDPTLIKSGRFYPPGVANSAEDRLRYYAGQFPIVEVDATYYAPPRQEQAGLWVDRTPPDFVFNVKAFSLLTGHPTLRKALPADLEDAILPEHRDKERIYPAHLDPDAIDEFWVRLRDALLPLDSAGKL